MEPIGFIPDRKSPNRKQRRAERPGRREISEGAEQAVLLWHEENFDHLVTMFLIQLDRIPDGYDRFLSGGFAELVKAKADQAVNLLESSTPGLSLSDLQGVLDHLVAIGQGVTDADDLSPDQRAESLKAYFSQLASK